MLPFYCRPLRVRHARHAAAGRHTIDDRYATLYVTLTCLRVAAAIYICYS